MPDTQNPQDLVARDDTQSVRVYLTPELEKNLDLRLARIEGHVRSIRRMLAEHTDCETLLIQMSAVKAAMNQVIVKTLEGHIATCVSACAQDEETLQALERLRKALGLVLKNA
ncbi:MAG: metal-sensitive transcriptional regulator [Ardenticatenia bacterium]|nr:metal-sensitive transcriptional regulator [Ardenticatenia bacterium]